MMISMNYKELFPSFRKKRDEVVEEHFASFPAAHAMEIDRYGVL